jgi:high frequency lysogenization protein
MSGAAMQGRVLALAGLVQALAEVRRIAETGQADATALRVALESIFRIDADSPEAVYGGTAALQPGLRLLRGWLRNETGAAGDAALPKLAFSVLQLERRFVASDAAPRVQAGIQALATDAREHGVIHPGVLAGLGRLYADTVSHLRPRVMVQGNPHYLGQSQVVAEIRAVLLAALRSAVLWRQLGGSLWDFALRRRALAATVDALL